MIYPNPGIEPEPSSESDEAVEPDPMSLRTMWQRNGLAMVLVAGLTLAGLAVCAASLPVRESSDGVRLLLAQLWIMLLVMPVAAHWASRPMDVLYRAGVTNDAFGAFMVVLAFWYGHWGWLGAIKLYLLTSAVGLALTGFVAALRCAELPRLVTTTLMAVACFVVAGFHTAVDALPVEEAGVLGRVNLLTAAADALGAEERPVSWVVTALIYGAAAGLCWSWLLIAGPSGLADEPAEE